MKLKLGICFALFFFLTSQTYAISTEEKNLILSIHKHGQDVVSSTLQPRGGYDLLSFCGIAKLLTKNRMSKGVVAPHGHGINSLLDIAKRKDSKTARFFSSLLELRQGLTPFIEIVSEKEFCKVPKNASWIAQFNKVGEYAMKNPDYVLDTETVFSVASLLMEFEQNVLEDLENKGLIEITGKVDYENREVPFKF